MQPVAVPASSVQTLVAQVLPYGAAALRHAYHKSYVMRSHLQAAHAALLGLPEISALPFVPSVVRHPQALIQVRGQNQCYLRTPGVS